MLAGFITRCRMGWPARGRLAEHRRGTYAFEQGAEVAARLAAAFGDLSKLAAADLGAGPAATPVAQAVMAIPWKRLVQVELFPPYLEALKQRTAAAAEREIVAREIEDAVAGDALGEVDIAVMIDVLEHMTKAKGLRLLRLLEKKARRGIAIFSPVGDVPQDDIDGNELQRHRSSWANEEWLRLGYDVEFYEAFHGHLAPAADAAWAIKSL